MTYNNYEENMYCSDQDDWSEQPYEGGQSDYEYDSGPDYYDDYDSNSVYVPMLVPAERSMSETRRSRRSVTAPPMVQLLSEKRAKETGCTTWKQWQQQMAEQREAEERQREEQENKRVAAEEKERKKKEEAEKAKWDAILAKLPTESKLGKQKRLAKEAAERELKRKLTWAKRKKSSGKKLPFGHRRNGGGKRRAKMVQHGSVEAQRLEAVIKKRRATRRKAAKATKKEAEVKRTAEFASAAPQKKTNTVVIDYIKEDPIDSDDEEAVMLKKIEKEHQEAQANMIREIQEKQAKVEEEKERQRLFDENAKIAEQFAKGEAALKDERENGTWSVVKKKSTTQPTPKKKKKKVTQKKMLFNFVTPRMAEEEKRREGRSKLMDKDGMRERLIKTRMCNSVGSGRVCPHGSRCRYAHSVEELRVAPCFFKDACRHVKKSGDGYRNCSHRRCTFLHPGEDMKNYCQRLNIPFKPVAKPVAISPVIPPTPITIVPRKPVTKPIVNIWEKRSSERKEVGVETPKVVEKEWTDVKRSSRSRPSSSGSKSSRSRPSSSRSKSSSGSKKKALCNSIGTGKPCRHGAKCRFQHLREAREDGQVVIRVPNHLATAAMKHVVSIGLKNFRIEVI